jgi:hypothetical protein
MIDLDQSAQLRQADSQNWFDRAARLYDRQLAAGQAVTTCLANHDWTNRPGARYILALPPELAGLGRLAAAFAAEQGIHAAMRPTSVQPPLQPCAQLFQLAAPVAALDLAALNLATLDLATLDDVTAAATATINLTPYVTAHRHPAETLHILLGMLAAVDGRLAAAYLPSPAVVETLAHCGPEIPTDENPAKQLALRLNDRLPLFWAGERWTPVARDWAMRYFWYAEAMSLVADEAEMNRLLVMARLPRYWPNSALFVQLPAPALPTESGTIGALSATPASTATVTHLLARRRFTTVVAPAPAVHSLLDHALYLLEFGEWLALYAAALYNVDPAQQVPLSILFDG